MKTRVLGILIVMILASAVLGTAQTEKENQAGTVFIYQRQAPADARAMELSAALKAQGATYSFIATEVGFESRIVTGAPFSADTVTEFSQTLGNGQKIYRKSTSAIYRDSQGRTRREQTIGSIGPFAPSAPEKKVIYIYDPVAQMRYTLDPENRTATVVKTGEAGQGVSVSESAGSRVVIATTGGGVVGASAAGGRGRVVETPFGTIAVAANKAGASSNVKTEPLGTQQIEGTAAEGTRTTSTIPTGAIGNDSPIESYTEQWYSPELQVVVKSTHNDPMSGENVYRLTNIRRGDPSPTLFQLPAGYTVVKEMNLNFSIKPAKAPEPDQDN